MEYINDVKYLSWSIEKNLKLKNERGISFEEVTVQILSGNLLDVLTHKNQERYPGQRVLVVRINNYAFLVPYVETESEVFLKTVIPSRQATKKYIGK
jgi:hypothetical protein